MRNELQELQGQTDLIRSPYKSNQDQMNCNYGNQFMNFHVMFLISNIMKSCIVNQSVIAKIIKFSCVMVPGEFEGRFVILFRQKLHQGHHLKIFN